VGLAVQTAMDDRERFFRRAVAISLAGHVLLVIVSVVSPFPRSRSTVMPGVMNVSLVSATPVSAPKASAKPPAAKPKPKPPTPAAKPPPPKPEVKAKEKVLPKEAMKQPKPEPPKPKNVAPPPQPEEKLDYADALDELRDELDEEVPADQPDPELVASVGKRPSGPPGHGPGDPVDPEVADWARRVRLHVKRNWILDAGLARQIIEAEVTVTLDATGNVIEAKVTAPSGNAGYDASVLRAIDKSSPLPPPPDSGEWPLYFNPQD
jgi:colicin import membrane protein